MAYVDNLPSGWIGGLRCACGVLLVYVVSGCGEDNVRLKNKARSIVNVFWQKNASNLDNFFMVTADPLFHITTKFKKIHGENKKEPDLFHDLVLF